MTLYLAEGAAGLPVFAGGVTRLLKNVEASLTAMSFCFSAIVSAVSILMVIFLQKADKGKGV